MNDTKIAVIGGSGIYDIDGLDGAEWVSVQGPWGAPSDQVLTGCIAGVNMAFLPRHGRGHVHAPHDVPYRANIDALKRLGVTDVISEPTDWPSVWPMASTSLVMRLSTSP